MQDIQRHKGLRCIHTACMLKQHMQRNHKQAVTSDRHNQPVSSQAVTSDREDQPVSSQSVTSDRHNQPVSLTVTSHTDDQPVSSQAVTSDRHNQPVSSAVSSNRTGENKYFFSFKTGSVTPSLMIAFQKLKNVSYVNVFFYISGLFCS